MDKGYENCRIEIFLLNESRHLIVFIGREVSIAGR